MGAHIKPLFLLWLGLSIHRSLGSEGGKSHSGGDPSCPRLRYAMVACSPCVAHQERHLSGSDGLGCNYEVTFILAVLRVEHNDEFAIFCGESRVSRAVHRRPYK